MAALSLSQIRVDSRLQSRAAGVDLGTVADYTDAMLAGDIFPAVIVYQDGEVFYLVDGFHRFEAAQKAEREEIEADVRLGTFREALLFSKSVNGTHGLRRSREDIRKAITDMLQDPEWSPWSDREISRHVGCDHKTVGKVRAELTGDVPTDRTYITRHGTVATMQVPARETAGPSLLEKMTMTISTSDLLRICMARPDFQKAATALGLVEVV